MTKNVFRYAILPLVALGLSACEPESGDNSSDRNEAFDMPGEETDGEESEDGGDSEKGKKDKSDKNSNSKSNKWECLHHHAYWKTHSANSKGKKAEPWPLSEDTELCGQTWYEILWTPPAGNVGWYKLAYQWIAAELNVALGAVPTDATVAAMEEAETILAACDIEGTDGQATHGVWKSLHAFNHGQTDHSCGGEDDSDDETDEETTSEDPTESTEDTSEDTTEDDSSDDTIQPG